MIDACRSSKSALHWLIEQRQVEALSIDQLELRPRSLLGVFVNPLGNGLATRPGRVLPMMTAIFMAGFLRFAFVL
jgi:hypothetical protein